MNERDTQTTNDETEIETSDNQLTVRRTVDAPRERVFEAFTQPEELEQWYSHGGATWEVHALEPEPGGVLSLSMQEGENYFEIEGEFVEVVEGERIVHTWYVGRVTIEFEDAEDGTEVVLTHENLPDSDVVEQHTTGWKGALENLAELAEER